MALAICSTTVDTHGRELLQHGTAAFPVACYDDDLRKNKVPWHWHEEFEAAVVAEGAALITAGKEKFTIPAENGFFINTGILHGAWRVDCSACRLHSLVFHPRLVGGSLDSVFYQNYVLPLSQQHALESIVLSRDIPWQRETLDAIVSAWQCCADEPPGFTFTVRSALSNLVFQIHSHLPAITRHTEGKAIRNGERIKTMLQYIHDNYANELSASLIAKSAAISESECLRCFRATIGATPMQYVKQYRIEKAAQLLLSTPQRVFEIAIQCGFQDVSYFTKSFRELKGCVPTRFRSIKATPHNAHNAKSSTA